ncbi:hypothetical protein [Amycolatopsis suaedae]|uniref:Uncharacterized protein n=1 Tax=Amycolatopsis suaedae TaxID=2510978 RepID=A0A4Q7J9X2_9PSEU|nr:hypothetical protein [Amycolatopsis suaedae]RZQ64590.1 hypothetical protein EWH70_06700 [Amycolatopsis suaedae]
MSATRSGTNDDPFTAALRQTYNDLGASWVLYVPRWDSFVIYGPETARELRSRHHRPLDSKDFARAPAYSAVSVPREIAGKQMKSSALSRRCLAFAAAAGVALTTVLASAAPASASPLARHRECGGPIGICVEYEYDLIGGGDKIYKVGTYLQKQGDHGYFEMWGPDGLIGFSGTRTWALGETATFSGTHRLPYGRMLCTKFMRPGGVKLTEHCMTR